MTGLEFDDFGRVKIPGKKIDPKIILELTNYARDFERDLDNRGLNSGLNQIERFNQLFNLERIKNMTVEDYCYGFKESFCWWIEEGTIDVAHTGHDGFNREYGIWFSDKEKQFYKVEGVRSVKISKETASNKLEEIKRAIIRIINNTKNNKFDEIREEKDLWHQVKAKIAYLYFPDKTLPILSKKHLEEMCKITSLVNYDQEDHLGSSHRLLNAMKEIEVFKNWHSFKISMFLYSKFENLVR